MCTVINHRGPDERGELVDGRAALGMQRLKVIDLESGKQPIFSADRNLAIVFNGEIYNFRELRTELEARGHGFTTKSDTEVILRAFEEWGTKSVDRLRGMFAFAIWDARNESLFIARDRVGKKPLFYSFTPGGDFVFGSELKSLLVHPNVPRNVDLSALDAYLTFGYVPEQFCIFEGIEKLPPGSFLEFRGGKVNVQQYWDFNYAGSRAELEESGYIERLRELLEESVRIRLISDVPLGAFLSGGVDSSAIVGLMTKFSGRPVKTFSIGFNEDRFNELKYARIAAEHFRTEHHEFIVTPEIVNIVDDMVWHFDEPFADSSALPTYMVSKLAREYVTVVLSGDGGDELFGGYARYVTERKRGFVESIPSALRRDVLQAVSKRMPHSAPGKNYLFNISLDGADRYIDSISQFNSQRREKLYSGDLMNRLNGGFGAGEKTFAAITDVAPDDEILKILYLDAKTYLPGDILTKVDRMSMANSLEARAPLLDHELIEFVAGIPHQLKLKGIETKYIFKKALKGLVPDEILFRKKQGFGVPIGEWINSQLSDRILTELVEPRTVSRGYFNQDFVNVLIDEHRKKRRDHSHQLWALWMFECWNRQNVDTSR